jgi:hypothetical protein
MCLIDCIAFRSDAVAAGSVENKELSPPVLLVNVESMASLNFLSAVCRGLSKKLYRVMNAKKPGSWKFA